MSTAATSPSRSQRRWWVVGAVVLVAALLAVFLGRSDPPSARSATRPERPDGTAGALSRLLTPENEGLSRCRPGDDTLARCGPAPALRKITTWLNTLGGRPLPLTSLRGKVVLVDFWTYSCINCRRHQPYLDAWYDAYRAAGLEVVGVHSPQRTFERSPTDVAAAVRALGIRHPVALDPTRATMTAYRDRYWPATYLVDAEGQVRALSFGEGGEARTERQLRALLREADPSVRLPDPVGGSVRTLAPPVEGTTPELKLGWSVSAGYAGQPGRPVPDVEADYTPARRQSDDTFSLSGRWRVGTQAARSVQESQVQVSALSRRVYAVIGGTGTVTVRDGDQDLRTIEVGGRPDVHLLLDGDRRQRRVLTLEVSAGVDLYALSFG